LLEAQVVCGCCGSPGRPAAFVLIEQFGRDDRVLVVAVCRDCATRNADVELMREAILLVCDDAEPVFFGEAGRV
jgi:hypothetical protein